MDESVHTGQAVHDATPTPVTAVPDAPQMSPSSQKKAFWEMQKYGIVVIAILAASGASVYFFTQAKQPAPVPITVPTQVPAPTAALLSLVVVRPNSGDVAVDGEILVKGTTLPRISVALYSDSDDTIVESDEGGNFEGTLSMEKGENILTVTAFTEDGQEKSTTLTVSY